VIYLIATSGFLTPTPTAQGQTIWGFVGWLALIFLFSTARAKKKGLSLSSYISLKYSRLNNWVNAAEIVQTAVDDFNKSRDVSLPQASYVTSKIYGSFVAVNDVSGNLLTEAPIKKIGAWFWLLLTVFIVYVLT